MVRQQFTVAVIAGVALALPYLLYALRRRDRARVFGIGLVLATSVYVVPAAVAGDIRDLGVELIGVILFGAIAVLGARRSMYWLAFGWIGHVTWDLLLHPAGEIASKYVLWWYPPACLGFDLLVAGAILGLGGRITRLTELVRKKSCT